MSSTQPTKAGECCGRKATIYQAAVAVVGTANVCVCVCVCVCV